MSSLDELRAACAHAEVDTTVSGLTWCRDCGHVLTVSKRARGRGTVAYAVRGEPGLVEFRCLGCRRRTLMRREDAASTRGYCPSCHEQRGQAPHVLADLDAWAGRKGGSQPNA